jgi:hypothetical protein
MVRPASSTGTAGSASGLETLVPGYVADFGLPFLRQTHVEDV